MVYGLGLTAAALVIITAVIYIYTMNEIQK